MEIILYIIIDVYRLNLPQPTYAKFIIKSSDFAKKLNKAKVIIFRYYILREILHRDTTVCSDWYVCILA